MKRVNNPSRQSAYRVSDDDGDDPDRFCDVDPLDSFSDCAFHDHSPSVFFTALRQLNCAFMRRVAVHEPQVQFMPSGNSIAVRRNSLSRQQTNRLHVAGGSLFDNHTRRACVQIAIKRCLRLSPYSGTFPPAFYVRPEHIHRFLPIGRS